MFITTAVTAAPDVFVHPVNAAASSPLTMALVIGAMALIVIGLFIVIRSDDKEQGGAYFAFFAIAAVAVAVMSSFSYDADSDAEHEARAAAYTAYVSTASEWLAADYGIETDDETVKQLLDGDQLTADYDGGKTLVTLSRTTTGHLSVIDSAGSVVPALDR